MKKVRLLFSLAVAIPLMASCGDSKSTLHTIKFSGTDCILNTSDGKKFTEGKYKEGAKLSFTFVPVRDHANPTDNEVKIVNAAGEYFTNYDYNSKDGKLNVTLTDDITITASTTEERGIQTISLIGDNHIQIKEQVTFVKGDHSPITVPYTIDSGFTIGSTTVTPSSTLSYTYSDGFNLIITPKVDEAASKIEIKSIKRAVSLFNSDDSTFKIMDCHYLPNSIEVGMIVKTEKQDLYCIPPDSQYFRILASDGSQPSFTYQRLTNFSAKLVINDTQPVRTETYTIKATDYQYLFNIATDFGNYMESPDLPSPAYMIRDIDLVFTLKIKEEANISAHTIPYSLDLKLSDGTPLPKAAYKIDCTDPTRQVATVTIYANYITGNFSITGKATEINYFVWDILVCGADLEGGEDGYLHGVSSQDSGATFYISGNKVSQITLDRIIVEDLDGNIHCPNDDDCPSIYKSFTITQDGDRIDLKTGTNVAYDYVAIYVSVPNYEFFSKLSWSTINKFVEKGWHQTFFRVGETKEVLLNNGLTYDVRIIDFNHDDLADEEGGGKAGITLEFVELITNQDGSLRRDQFSANDAEYDGSKYRIYLEQQFFFSLPDEITTHIKTVKKTYAKWLQDPDTLETKIFPLSLTELNLSHTYAKNEGSTYAYYSGGDKNLRSKSAVGAGEGIYSSYWTRSAYYMHYNGFAFAIDSDGELADSEAKDSNKGYTAAFCI